MMLRVREIIRRLIYKWRADPARTLQVGTPPTCIDVARVYWSKKVLSMMLDRIRAGIVSTPWVRREVSAAPWQTTGTSPPRSTAGCVCSA
jgi:hypothetical protein